MPDFTQNYFQLFGMPQAFRIDALELLERYHVLQQNVHPDRHAADSDHERRFAMQYAAFVNEAFRTLNDPLSRAVYLLDILATDQSQTQKQSLPLDFLQQQMALRERLAEAGVGQSALAAVSALRREIVQEQEHLGSGIEKAFDRKDFAEVFLQVQKGGFFRKLLEEVEELEVQLENQLY